MDELEKAIKTDYSGGAMINPEVATKVVDSFLKWHKVIMIHRFMHRM